LLIKRGEGNIVKKYGIMQIYPQRHASIKMNKENPILFLRLSANKDKNQDSY
jgi:hypothetical protein